MGSDALADIPKSSPLAQVFVVELFHLKRISFGDGAGGPSAQRPSSMTTDFISRKKSSSPAMSASFENLRVLRAYFAGGLFRRFQKFAHGAFHR